MRCMGDLGAIPAFGWHRRIIPALRTPRKLARTRGAAASERVGHKVSPLALSWHKKRLTQETRKCKRRATTGGRWLTQQRIIVMGISTWKLKLTCPRCGKQYLHSNIKGDMLMHSTVDPIRGWRFSKLPNNLRCEDCGDIDPQTVSCDYPVRVLQDWSLKTVFTILIPAITVLALLYTISYAFRKW